MTTRQNAAALVGELVACQPVGWTDQGVESMAREIESWADDYAAAVAIKNVCDSWTGHTRPPFGVIVGEYRRQAQRNREQTESEERGDSHYIDAASGRQLAEAAHQRAYGRPMHSKPTADPDRAREVIMRRGSYVKGRYVCPFIELFNEWNGDGSAADASVKALGRAITREWNGTLLYDPGSPEEPLPEVPLEDDDLRPFNPLDF